MGRPSTVPTPATRPSAGVRAMRSSSARRRRWAAMTSGPYSTKRARVDEVVDVLAGRALPAGVAAVDGVGPGGVEADGVAVDDLGEIGAPCVGGRRAAAWMARRPRLALAPPASGSGRSRRPPPAAAPSATTARTSPGLDRVARAPPAPRPASRRTGVDGVLHLHRLDDHDRRGRRSTGAPTARSTRATVPVSGETTSTMRRLSTRSHRPGRDGLQHDQPVTRLSGLVHRGGPVVAPQAHQGEGAGRHGVGGDGPHAATLLHHAREQLVGDLGGERAAGPGSEQRHAPPRCAVTRRVHARPRGRSGWAAPTRSAARARR